MWKAATFFGALGTIVLSGSAVAQISSNLDTQWRSKMHRDKDAAYTFGQLQDALKIAEQFGDGDPRSFETIVELAVLCQDEDEVQGCEGKSKLYMDRAFKMGPKVKTRDAHFASLLMDLGGAADPRLAPSVYRDALDIRERLFGAEDQSVAEVYAAMAAAYQASGDKSGARHTMQYALEIRERVHKERTAGYADLLEDSGRIYMSANDPEHAQAEYERALALRESLWGASDPRFVEATKRIAGNTWFEKRRTFSEKLYRRIVDIQRKTHGEKSEAYYSALWDLASFLRYQNRLAESQSMFEQACAVREKMGERDVLAARCLEDLARVRMARAKYRDAIEAGEASFQIRARLQKPEERSTISVDALLAEAYLRANEAGRSEAYFRALHNEVRSDSYYTLEDTAEKLSAIYQERGNYPEAATKLQVAVASMEAQNPADPRLPQQEIKLANLYQLSGRPNDANRMNMAAIRAVGRNLKTQGDPAPLRYLFVGLFVLFFALPIAGTVTFGILFGWFGRRMDRKLALLYCPAPEAAEVSAQPSSAADRAFVGGFLGLAPVAEMEPNVLTVAVAETSPVVMPGPQSARDPQPAAEIPEPPVSQVALHADGSDLFAMRVLNLLLSLLTLGIYSFWGKAKVRRYVCGQAEYLGDWFAFHGTGRDLLFGWLRALPALAFIFLFPTVLPLFWQHRASPYVAQLCAVLAFLILWPIARVGAYRYRLNRMSWRAIRFSYRGKAPRYLAESAAGWLLSLVTLGLYVPFLQVRLRKLLMNQTYFGDRVFQFPGRGFDLLPAWLFALPLTVCSFGIGWAWWRALGHRYCWAHTTFAGGRFRCTATGGKLLWLWVGNFFLIVPTLGLGMSWATLRTLRFWTKHIQLVGEPELVSVQQDARATTAAAESFADFLGFDFGF